MFLVGDLTIFFDENKNLWTIYKHQAETIIKGNEGKGFVVLSSTGSGKSLTYISNIFKCLFKNQTNPGIKAIIVYLLNALINDQKTAFSSFHSNYKKEQERILSLVLQNLHRRKNKKTGISFGQ